MRSAGPVTWPAKRGPRVDVDQHVGEIDVGQPRRDHGRQRAGGLGPLGAGQPPHVQLPVDATPGPGTRRGSALIEQARTGRRQRGRSRVGFVDPSTLIFKPQPDKPGRSGAATRTTPSQSRLRVSVQAPLMALPRGGGAAVDDGLQVGSGSPGEIGGLRYDLNRQPPPAGQLRPLRRADENTDRGVPTPPLGVSGDKHQALDFARMMALPPLADPAAPAAIEDQHAQEHERRHEPVVQ